MLSNLVSEFLSWCTCFKAYLRWIKTLMLFCLLNSEVQVSKVHGKILYYLADFSHFLHQKVPNSTWLNHCKHAWLAWETFNYSNGYIIDHLYYFNALLEIHYMNNDVIRCLLVSSLIHIKTPDWVVRKPVYCYGHCCFWVSF